MPADGGQRTAGKVERVLALRSFPGLALVDTTHLGILAEVAEERVFPKGATITLPGKPVSSMHFIRRGEVAILREGREMRRFSTGDIVGAIPSMTRDPLGHHVVALVETRTFEIDADDLDDVLEESFSLMLAALRGTNRGVMESRMQIPGDAGFSSPILEPFRPATELGLVERVLFLRNSLGFAKVSVEALAEFAREMTVVRIPTGTELWQVADPSPHLLLIWSGVVRCDTPTGQLFRLGPDSAVGGIDSVADEPRWYRAVAETDLVALRAETANLMDVLEDHPDMGLAMLRSTARILAELYDSLDRMALESDPPGP